MAALGNCPDPPVTAGEERILSLVYTVLDETEYRLPGQGSVSSEMTEGDCGAYEPLSLPDRAQEAQCGRIACMGRYLPWFTDMGHC